MSSDFPRNASQCLTIEYSGMLLTILIPVFNEERLVARLLRKIIPLDVSPATGREIIVIDDGSTDGTRRAIEEVLAGCPDGGIRMLVHDRNRGKGAAVRTGLGVAAGEVVIIQDADLEYDPEDIPALVGRIVGGTAKVVYGSRILREKALGRSGCCGLMKGKHPDSYALAYLGGIAITRWTNMVTGAMLTDEPTCYKCFHREVLAGLIVESDDFAWEPEITVKVLNGGWRIEEVPIGYHPRKLREGKKINWKDGVKALWTVWKYGRPKT